MTRSKRWSYSTGQRGRNRVRVFENRHGTLYVEFYERTRDGLKPKRVSLGHKDRDKAKRQADRIAVEFGEGEPAKLSNPTLQQLFDKYLNDVTPGKGVQQQKHDRRAVQLLLQLFGPLRKARTLNADDWSRYIKARQSGALTPQSGTGKPVSNRTVETDLKFLLAVLNWATKVRVGDEPLLASNPLRGLTLPKEKNPRRPVLSADEYEALRAVAPSIDWRFALAVTLCHETGHRIGAVRVLQWSDIDIEKGLVTWRAASDKTGREHKTPLSDVALEALKDVLQKNPVIGSSWLFPATRDVNKPVSPRAMQMWMDDALEAIGLADRRGLGFHALRRKFATELRDIPLKDLMSLGGWKDHRTILQCYQHPDLDELRDVLQTRRQSTHQIHSPAAESSGS